MNRNVKLINLLSLPIIASISGCDGVKEKKELARNEKPNIVFILADDLGYGDLGCYGQSIIETPNLDQLAEGGMIFTRHYAGSTVCAPSRASLMTGKHTGHTPVRGNKPMFPEGQHPIPDETFTMAEMLKDAGYVTGAFGKWGLGGPGSEGDPINQGFDVFFGYNCQRMAHRYYPEYLWDNDQKYYLEGNDWNNQKTYAPDVIHQKAKEFIKNNADTSFFIFIPSVIPHAELIVPEDSLFKKYDGRFTETAFQGNDYGSEDFSIPGYCSQEKPKATFAAMVNRLDHQVGEIVQLISELNLEKKTIIFFSSDNGPHMEAGANPDFFASNGKYRGYKRDLYEGGIRVPFIASWKGVIEPGVRCKHISAFWDLMPTFAELAGGIKTEHIDGISFVPALTGRDKEQTGHEYLYWEFHERGGRQAIRKGNWKGVKLNMTDNPSAPVELYNLEQDPYEKHDISEFYPQITAEIDSLMQLAHNPDDIFRFAFEDDRIQTYSATEDFNFDIPGYIPFYKHKRDGQAALGINPSVYTDKEAAAVMFFKDDPGIFDIELTYYQEKDGESYYKLFVDDKLAGDFRYRKLAPGKHEDYHQHTWKKIKVNKGSQIKVVVRSHSNKVFVEEVSPGGYAWSRGRWSSLKFTRLGQEN